ncbi:troponin domain-containing protein [Ditylenchus destructor]|nr:troponin domain-containing protein [Ditylenchus destructor]
MDNERNRQDDVDEDEADKARRVERERKKAEVRKRLEEAGRMKKAKKGFLTPERKKKLRKLLMLKAAEDLKMQQQLRAEERHRVLHDRIIPMPVNFDQMTDPDELEDLANEFRERILILETEVYDLSYTVRQKDFVINELTIAVNDLRGKFVKPTLKRTNKTETQFDKIKKQNAAKVDFRAKLKTVDLHKFSLQ